MDRTNLEREVPLHDKLGDPSQSNEHWRQGLGILHGTGECDLSVHQSIWIDSRTLKSSWKMETGLPYWPFENCPKLQTIHLGAPPSHLIRGMSSSALGVVAKFGHCPNRESCLHCVQHLVAEESRESPRTVGRAET